MLLSLPYHAWKLELVRISVSLLSINIYVHSFFSLFVIELPTKLLVNGRAKELSDTFR